MLQDEIERLLAPTIEDMGYELWGFDYLSQGKHTLLRIYIDKESGIGIEDCEKVSRQVSALLDVEDPISGNYNLEVSSPGIPRPLFKAKQYVRYLGEGVHIKLFKPVDGRRKFKGKIISANESTVMLEVEGLPQEFSFSNIVKANLTDE